MSKKVTYIIPLHKKTDLVFRAMDSVQDKANIIVCIPEAIEDWFMERAKDYNVTTVTTDEKTSYPALVNAGIRCCEKVHPDTDYISILEYDDTVLANANKIIDEYGSHWEDAEVLVPLAYIVKYDDTEEKPILVGIANEAAMAPQIAEEFGLFDFNMMLRTNFLFVNGCYIKPSVFESYGKFKENFELFYDYEWALRVVYNAAIVKSIPKATHFHTLTDGSAFETHKALPRETLENWMGATKREYFFEDDRPIKFN